MPAGTKDDPWMLTTPPGTSEYSMYKDEDAEPAADGPRLPLSDVDAGSRVTDRSRLGVAVGLDGLVHDLSRRLASIN